MTGSAAIGVFDSGLGGLTVARAMRERLPAENLIFLGDTARVPYGTRSSNTVMHYARNCARSLCEFDIKLLAIACNTVSAVALDALSAEFDVPVLGVVAPGARVGARKSSVGRIGVIATPRTVASQAYEKAVAEVDPTARVIASTAPLLVPLAEEGWTRGIVPELVVRRYLEPLVRASIDVLVLGCTHYPLLQEVIEEQLEQLSGWSVPVVDGAQAAAHEVAAVLERDGLGSDGSEGGTLTLLVTDMPNTFADLASRFLGREVDIDDVQQIDL